MLSSYTNVVPNLYDLVSFVEHLIFSYKKLFWDVSVLLVHTVQVNGCQYCLVLTFFKIYFYVLQNKKSHTGLEHQEGEKMTSFNFWANYPFNSYMMKNDKLDFFTLNILIK